jgi:hypothetical protein
MNCGLANLATLKSLILPAQLRPRTDWDDQLAALGFGSFHWLLDHVAVEAEWTPWHVEAADVRSVLELPVCVVVPASHVAFGFDMALPLDARTRSSDEACCGIEIEPVLIAHPALPLCEG